jgi:cobalt-zinc-cadmium efflux system outer membrane protein
MKTLAFILLFILNAGILLPIDTLSVKKVVNIALKNNPDLQIKKQEILSSAKDVYINASPEKTNLIFVREGMNNGNFAEQQFWVSQYLDFPLKTFAGVAADNAVTERLKAEYTALEREIVKDVKQAYANIAYSGQYAHLKRKQYKIIDSLVKVIELKLEAGMATQLDLMKSEILLEKLKSEMKDAEIAFHTARYALFALVGLDPEKQKYDIMFSDSLIFKDIDIKQQYVFDQISKLPLINASEYYSKELDKRKNAVSYDYLPDLNLSYYKQDLGNGFDFTGIEFGINVPLWFALDQNKKSQKIEIQRTIAESRKTKLILNLKKEIEYAWHGYDESRKKIKIYHDNILPKSRQLMKLNLTAYREGLIELLQFLDTQNLHIDNEIQYYKELKNYYLQLIELEKYTENELIFESN